VSIPAIRLRDKACSQPSQGRVVEHFDKSDGSRRFQITDGADVVRARAQVKLGAMPRTVYSSFTSNVALLSLTGTHALHLDTHCHFIAALSCHLETT
jgi:hypothetical protein